MQVASHTNPQNLPLDADGKRGWSNSLFDCFSDCGTCMFPQHVFLFCLFVNPLVLSQVSPPLVVPASCTLRSTAGLNISPAMDLPTPLVVRLSAAIVSLIASLSTVVSLVFCGFVSPWLPISLGELTIAQTMQRGETRARYNVAGSGVNDFLTACCCHVCGLVQESREIELEEGSYGK